VIDVGADVLSPLQLFDKGDFRNYWYESASPRFIPEYLKKRHEFSLEKFRHRRVSELFISSQEIERAEPESFLYQAGYLTLEGEEVQNGMSYYILRFPNGEVRSSFEAGLLTAYNYETDPYAYVYKLGRAAKSGETGQLIELLREFFAGLSYDIQVKQEKYYQSIVYTIFRMCGMEMQTEVTTNIGRIDGVLDTEGHLYIIEFKLERSAAEAVAQIDTQKYAEQYIRPAREKGQRVHALGINFSYEQGVRNITDWQEKILGD